MIRVSASVRIIRTGTRNDRFGRMKSIRFPCRGPDQSLRTGVRKDGFRGLDGWEEFGAVPRRKAGIESRKWVSEHGIDRQGNPICGQHGLRMLLKQKGGGRKEGEREEMRHRGLLFMGKIKERGYFGPITHV
jgi:hypothetical protein